MITVRAAAKVNLHLGVGRRRPDGYHGLVTAYQAIGLYDDVTVEGDSEWSVHLRGDAHIDLQSVPVDEENLAVRAGRELVAHHGLDETTYAARIEIHKGIPVAGGLAGGSADAAAALVALDRLWDLQTPDDDLLGIAARLGSDVPFALVGGTATGTGRGEQIARLPDGGDWWWVVVGSERGLATPEVYARFDQLLEGATVAAPEIPHRLVAALETGDVIGLAESLENDLQAAALDLRPDLRRTLDDGRETGALAGLLSGSGPTVLLLCEDRGHAQGVVRALTDRGHAQLSVATAPVAGAHVVTHV